MNTVPFNYKQFKDTLFQAGGNHLEMTLCRPNAEGVMENICIEAVCKDYFTDVIWTEHTGEDTSIYGFKYKKGLFPLDAKEIHLAFWPRMTVTDANKFVKVNGQKITKFMKMYDEAMSFMLGGKTSTVAQLNDEQRLLISVPMEYAKYPYTFSLLLLMIRSGMLYSETSLKEFLDVTQTRNNPFSTNDKGYIAQSKETILKIASGKLIEKPWKEYQGGNTIHSYSGIMSMNQLFAKL